MTKINKSLDHANAKPPRKFYKKDYLKAKRAELKQVPLKHVAPLKRVLRAPQPIKKADSDQKKKVTVQKKQKGLKTIPKQAKSKAIKKKATLKVPSEKDKLKEIRLKLREEKQKIRDQKLKAKMIKQKLFDLVPNPKLPLITFNTVLESCPAKDKQVASKVVGAKRVFEMGGCCVFCNNREIIQCVQYNDIEGFKKCLKNYDQISNPFQAYSLDCTENILTIALQKNAVDIVKLILDYEEEAQEKQISRVKLPSINLEKVGTGNANKFQFYFPFRQVQLSRGGKEGNNAFTYDQSLRKNESIDYAKILKNSHPSLKILKLLQHKEEKKGGDHFQALSDEDIKQNLGGIVRSGNFEVLRYVVNELAANNWGYGFNQLHKSAVFQGEEAQKVKGIQKMRLQKKGFDQLQLTPVHLAAINPDSTIFKMFYKAYPTTNILDIEQRDIVHYAAANHNSEVLEYLISKKVEVNNRDIKGYTPLMVACMLGRIDNARLLVEESQRLLNQLDQESEDYQQEKILFNFSLQQGPKNNSPLHFASQNGFCNIVRLLVEEGQCDVNAKNSNSHIALTLACEQGHLAIVQYLVEKGSQIHGLDKQGKSPLIKAIMNGHLHVVSYLLRHGVNPNYKDNSENSALHYACGYGWLHIVKYLVQEAGADPNSVNEWRMSPILLAMLKGHFGIVDYLINLKDLNASFMDDQGRTLISQLCMNMNEDSAKNLQFLLSKNKIDITLKDLQGFTPLHHLANNNIVATAIEAVKNKVEKVKEKNRYVYRRGKKIKVGGNRRRYNNLDRSNNNRMNLNGYFEEDKDQAEFQSRLKDLEVVQLKCAELLVKAGISITDVTIQGQATALFIACSNQNYQLAELLMKKAPNAIQGLIKNDEQNILHLLSEAFYMQNNTTNILNKLIENNRQELVKMASQYDSRGFTPYQKYFYELVQLKDRIPAQMNESQKRYFEKNLKTRIIKTLVDVSQIYTEDLQYDISAYIGIPLVQRNVLEEMLKNSSITQSEYDKVISLKYEQEQDVEGNSDEDVKMKDQSKKRFKKVKEQAKDLDKQFEQFDEIENFDTSKESMKLFGIPIITLQNRKKKPQRKSIAVFQQKSTFNIKDFYGQQNTLDTVLHLFIVFFQKIEQAYQLQFLDVFRDILRLSKKSINKQDPIDKQGFNKFNKESQNILFKAIQLNLDPIIDGIVESNLINFNLQSKKQNLSALHLLGHIINKEIIDKVLSVKQKLDIHINDKQGNTPLHYAAFNRNEYLINRLITLGADVNAQSKSGYTPIHMSIFSFNDSKDHTPQIERTLIEAGADLNLQDQDLRTPVFYLFFKNKRPVENVKKEDPANITIVLVQSGKIKDINHQDRNLNTCLHYACMNGSTISALTLINNGAKISATNIMGQTPFTTALYYKMTDLCIFLIQNECDISIPVKHLKSVSLQNFIQKEASNIILPRHIYEKYIATEQTYPSYQDYLNANYKLKEKSPFYFATKEKANGLGYLLLSKNFDVFQALADCLQCSMFEKFVDLIKNSGKIEYSRKDKKGRNLLHLLAANLDQINMQRGLDILDMLLGQYKIDPTALNTKGQNLLHVLVCNYPDFKTFNAVLNKLNPSQKQKLLSQKDKENKIPFIKLFTNEEFLQTLVANKDSLAVFLKDLNLKKFDLFYDASNAYTERQEGHNAIDLVNEGYLFNDLPFPVEVPVTKFQTYLAHGVIRHLNSSEEQDQQSMQPVISDLIQYGIDFNQVEPGTGLSPLILAIICNYEEIANIFIGEIFDEKLGEFKLGKKPIVNVNIQDKEGKTALHYAIKPCKFGTWQNYDFIEKLLKQGADSLIADKKGLNSFDYATQDISVYNLLQKYSKNGKPIKSKLKAEDRLPEMEIIIKQNTIIQRDANLNYDQDADKYIKQIFEKKQDKQMEIDGQNKIEPDKNGEFEGCEVVFDEKNQRHFDLIMTKVDVKKSYYGLCNFYVMQILFDKVKKIYILWTRWGRIGDVGQYQRTPFSIFEGAEAEFKKIYRQKAGVKWEDFAAYVPLSKKYVVKRIGGKVIYHQKQEGKWEYSERQFDEKEYILDFKTYKLVGTKLEDDKYDFVKPLVDQAGLLRQMKQRNIKKEFFLESLFDKDSLREMQKLLIEIKSENEKINLARREQKYEQFTEKMENLYELTNRYYELSNPTDFAQGKVQIISNEWLVDQEMNKLKLLYDFEHVTKMLFGAAYRIKEINPYDYCFNTLNVKLQQLVPQEDDFKLLVRYVNNSFFNDVKTNNYDNTPDNTIIHNIYRVNQQQKYDNTQVFNKLHNHFMLFHGTSNANVLSILEQGLQIAPNNSQGVRGQAFGRGIYLADLAKLALNYTDMAISDKDDFYMLVVEAALGNVCNILGTEDYTKDKLIQGYNSVRVMGRNGPKFSQNLVRTEDGTIWPIGKVAAYEDPQYKYKEQLYQKYSEIKELKEKKGEIVGKKGGNKKRGSKKEDKQDIEMIDTSSKKIEDEKKANGDYEAPNDDPKSKKYIIEPNVVSYKNFSEANNKWMEQQNAYYHLDQSEYVIFNTEQLRVRYVIHFKKMHAEE